MTIKYSFPKLPERERNQYDNVLLDEIERQNWFVIRILPDTWQPLDSEQYVTTQ